MLPDLSSNNAPESHISSQVTVHDLKLKLWVGFGVRVSHTLLLKKENYPDRVHMFNIFPNI